VVVYPVDGGPVPGGGESKAEADDEEWIPEGGDEADDRQTRADSGEGDRGVAGGDAPETDFDPDGILLSIAHFCYGTKVYGISALISVGSPAASRRSFKISFSAFRAANPLSFGKASKLLTSRSRNWAIAISST
jgi:hypothetical protein